MPELAEVVDGQAEEVDEGVGDEVHSEESGDDNDSIPDLEETEAAAGGEVSVGVGTVHFQKRDICGNSKFSGKRMYVDIVLFQKKRCRNKTFKKRGCILHPLHCVGTAHIQKKGKYVGTVHFQERRSR